MSTQRSYPFPYKTIPNIGKITCSGIDISNVSIIAVNPPPSEYTLTLPINAGAPGQVLQTDGTGILTWVNQMSNPGTVTSVSAAVPSFLSVSVSNPTTTPIINITYSGSALPISSGGTGLITVGANNTILRSNGSSLQYTTTVDSVSTSVPGSFLFTANVTFPATNPVITFAYSGILPIAYGGTGLSSVGSNGQVLTSNGSSLFYSTPTVGTVTNFSATITPVWTSSFITATVSNSTTTPALNIDFTNVTGDNALVLSDKPIFENWITVHGTGLGPLLGQFEDQNATPGSYLEIILGQDVTSTFDSGKIQFYYEGANDSFICLSHRNKRLRWFGASTAGAVLSSTAELTIDSPTSIRFTVQKTNPSPPPATIVRTLLFTGDADFTFPTTSGTSGYPLLTNGSGTTSWGPLGAMAGGTGLTTVGSAGQVLTSNGTTLFWQTNPLGTVTSVSASVPTWLSVTVINPTTTPFISITGTATGTGTVTVLQQDPTINGTLTLTDKMYIDRNNGSGQAIRIFNAHSTFPVDNYISIGHNSNALNHGHFGHRVISSNDAQNHLYWENNGNRMVMAATGSVGINTSTPNSTFKLDVNGYGRFNTIAAVVELNSSNGYLNFVSTGGRNYIQSGITGVSGSTADLVFGTIGNTAERMVITAAGYTRFNTSVGIGGTGNCVLGVGEGAFDTARYGTVSITQSTTITNGTGNIAQISFIRNGNYVHGLGYRQNSNIFGFGAGVTSNFQPSFISIDPSNKNIGMAGTLAPAYSLDLNTGGFPPPTLAVRDGFSGGFRTQWNVSGGQGETNFFNYRGGGIGGFWFKDLDTLNADIGWAPISCGAATLDSNGEILRLRGTDHGYMRYIIGGTNRAFLGFSNTNSTIFDFYNQYASGGFAFVHTGSTPVDLGRYYNIDNTGYASVNWATPSWNVSVGVGGGLEPQVIFRNKYYIYQNGPALVIDTASNTGLGLTSPTQKLDVNGNIRTRNSFTSNNVDFFTYSQTDFTPTIGFLTGATNNFVPAAVGGTITTFAYNIQTGRITRIGNIITVVVDISFNIQLSVAAAPGIYIAIRLPAECRPNSLGATAGGSWPATINVANMKGYVLLNGTDAGGNIAYICPVDQNERMLWSIYGVGLNNNQRLFPTITYCLR